MHLSARKSLKDGNIYLLKDDTEMEIKMSEKNKKWILLNAEEKANLLLPYLETRFMINEAISLNVDIKPDSIKVKEDRSATKDRYMCFAMFNYFGEKLINKLTQDNQYEEYNDSDWDFLSGDYSNVENYIA